MNSSSVSSGASSLGVNARDLADGRRRPKPIGGRCRTKPDLPFSRRTILTWPGPDKPSRSPGCHENPATRSPRPCPLPHAELVKLRFFAGLTRLFECPESIHHHRRYHPGHPGRDEQGHARLRTAPDGFGRLRTGSDGVGRLAGILFGRCSMLARQRADNQGESLREVVEERAVGQF